MVLYIYFYFFNYVTFTISTETPGWVRGEWVTGGKSTQNNNLVLTATQSVLKKLSSLGAAWRPDFTETGGLVFNLRT